MSATTVPVWSPAARRCAALLLCLCGAIAGCATMPQQATGAGADALHPAAGKGEEGDNGLERCHESLGTLAVVEDQNTTWYQYLRNYKLGSTVPVIRMMIQQSNCFVVVERGAAMNNMNTERALRDTGEMRGNSNFGKGQMVAADYTMSPSIQFSQNTGGMGAALGGFSGGLGILGAVAGGLKTNEAATTLIMIDNRSGVQLAAAEGTAKNTDFNMMGGRLGGALGGGASGYANSPEGKIIIAAFADSYNQLVKAVRNYQAQTVKGGLGTGGSLGVQGSSTSLPTPARPAPSKPATRSPQPSSEPPAIAAPRFERPRGDQASQRFVRVYFGTDRRRTGQDAASSTVDFSGARGSEVSYGTVDVSLPPTHRIGRLERPFVALMADPNKHVLTTGTRLLSAKDYWAEVSQEMASTGQRSTLVFLHGFNVGFDDAARRTAQIASDMGYQGVPMFFSWPSGGAIAKYLEDSSSAEWSQPHLEAFLLDMLAHTEASNVYLIAHSMGSRILAKAWAEIGRSLSVAQRSRIREIVLAAPDIDADIFKATIAPALRAAGAPVTLYASSTDRALQLSRQINGFARAGDAADGLVIADGIETIDASEIAEGVGHSYVLDTRSMLGDLQSLVMQSHRAAARFGLKETVVPSGRYWKLLP